MNNTLKLLRPLISDDLKSYSLNELSVKYQKNPDSKILATSYEMIYKLAIVIKSQYWGLTDEDVASWCLEKLDFCLRTYDYRPTRPVKFTTYFCRVFSNKLREETESLNYKKRKCILESINDLIDVGIEDTYNLIEMLLPDTLTQREYELCKLESEGYDKQTCADILGVSRMTISNMEKSLRVKLSDLLL